MEARLASFKVAIVEKGKESLWRTYWINGGSEGRVEAAPSELGRTEVVQETSLDLAIAAVERAHPDCTVMLAGGEHQIKR
jgi:hypothetical protein